MVTFPLLFVLMCFGVVLVLLSIYCEIKDTIEQIISLEDPLDGMLPYGVFV